MLDHQRLTDLFSEAVALPPARREVFLDSACIGEPELRREVLDLLNHENSASAAFDVAEQQITEPELDSVGPYELLELVGEGGMAVVYKAQQHKPVRRIVAVKLIKLGMDTRQFVVRFESERQALAMMDHPNVARVYDAGSTRTGRPYFVMEYVPGQRILEWCDARRLTVRDRLELFIPVCDAVEHAHRKGIIHRDLKNSNVLVTDVDGRALPKVIDFGVAKALSEPLTESTMFTEQGQLIGTPEYMSPEQADRGALNVDTRSDVYSLGVLLYQLLAGVPPIPSELLRNGSYEQVQRVIRETEPSRPSTRLVTVDGSDGARIAEGRRTALPTLIRALRSELEWIPIKAMRKDREQRYRSAAELADDIRNYLDQRPLLAGPETTPYKLRKFLRRYKFPVAAGAAMLLLLVGGIVATTWQAIRATRAEYTARTALREAQDANANTRAVNDFLTLDVLWSAEPIVTRGRELSVRQVLDNAASNVAARFKDRPRTEAMVRNTLAGAYRTLGHLDVALAHSQIAVEIVKRLGMQEEPEGLQVINDRGTILMERGDIAGGEELFRSTLATRRRVLGNDSLPTIESIGNLAGALLLRGKLAEAEPLVREEMRLRELHTHPDVYQPLPVARLGMILAKRGDVAGAVSLMRTALAQTVAIGGADHPHALHLRYVLAKVLHGSGSFAEAAELYDQTLAAQRRVLGDDHQATILTMDAAARVRVDQVEFERAEPLAVETLERSRRIYGPDHPETLARINNLARVRLYRGRLAEAQTGFRDALERSRRVRGAEHEQTLSIALNLAFVLTRLGKLDEAEPLLRQTLAVQQRVLGNDDIATVTSVNNLGGLLFDRGKFAEAEALFAMALDARRRALGPAHPDTLGTLSNLGRAVRAQSRHADAEPIFAELYKLTPTTQVPARQAALFISHWGPCLAQLGRYEQAESPLRNALDRLRATQQTHGEHMQRVLSALAETCEHTDRAEEAVRWRDELKSIAATTRPTTAPK